MGSVAVIGAWDRVRGWVLSGAGVHAADSTAEVRAAWRDLGPDVSVVMLTEQAAGDLVDQCRVPGAPLVVVIPS